MIDCPGIIQASEDAQDGPSYTVMTSSSKQNTKEPGVKESNTSSLHPTTEAIYAFRTITTMLSLIQSERGIAGKRPKLGNQDQRLLQLLDAFAAVLLRSNGVIAVTARPYDGSGKVEVLASYLDNGESLTISQSLSGQFVNLIRNVFISQNPRDSTVKQKVVVDPETSVPGNFKTISNPFELLNTFLINEW
jgi:hypothetical protein